MCLYSRKFEIRKHLKYRQTLSIKINLFRLHFFQKQGFGFYARYTLLINYFSNVSLTFYSIYRIRIIQIIV